MESQWRFDRNRYLLEDWLCYGYAQRSASSLLKIAGLLSFFCRDFSITPESTNHLDKKEEADAKKERKY